MLPALVADVDDTGQEVLAKLLALCSATLAMKLAPGVDGRPPLLPKSGGALKFEGMGYEPNFDLALMLPLTLRECIELDEYRNSRLEPKWLRATQRLFSVLLGST